MDDLPYWCMTPEDRERVGEAIRKATSAFAQLGAAVVDESRPVVIVHDEAVAAFARSPSAGKSAMFEEILRSARSAVIVDEWQRQAAEGERWCQAVESHRWVNRRIGCLQSDHKQYVMWLGVRMIAAWRYRGSISAPSKALAIRESGTVVR